MTQGSGSFGVFSICEQIGTGGMAVVHRAIETLPDGSRRVVALKRLHPSCATKPRYVETFVREAQITEVLRHPNIVETYAHGSVPGNQFISMEFIQGHSVLEVLRASTRNPLPIQVVVSLLIDLCTGLQYIHDKSQDGKPLGLIHRDISPANLILEAGGRLRIIDFGVAKMALVGKQTQGGHIKGKLTYLAPECHDPMIKPDGRADLFSVGVVAHELLTGRPLFRMKKSRELTMQSVRESHIGSPMAVNPDCPRALSTLVMRALERDREARCRSAAEMLCLLQAISDFLPRKANHLAVSRWLRTTFGSVDSTIRSKKPSEIFAPARESSQIETTRSRYPIGTLPTQVGPSAQRIHSSPSTHEHFDPTSMKIPNPRFGEDEDSDLRSEVDISFRDGVSRNTPGMGTGTPKPEIKTRASRIPLPLAPKRFPAATGKSPRSILLDSLPQRQVPELALGTQQMPRMPTEADHSPEPPRRSKTLTILIGVELLLVGIFALILAFL